MMETSVIETKLINAREIGYVSQVSSPDIKMTGKQAKRANQEEVRRKHQRRSRTCSERNTSVLRGVPLENSASLRVVKKIGVKQSDAGQENRSGSSKPSRPVWNSRFGHFASTTLMKCNKGSSLWTAVGPPAAISRIEALRRAKKRYYMCKSSCKIWRT